MNITVKRALGLIGSNVSLSLQEMRVIKSELKVLEDNTITEGSNQVIVPEDALKNILYIVEQIVEGSTADEDVREELFGIKPMSIVTDSKRRREIDLLFTKEVEEQFTGRLSRHSQSFLDSHDITVKELFVLATIGNYKTILNPSKVIKLSVFMKKALIYNFKQVTPTSTVVRNLNITNDGVISTLKTGGIVGWVTNEDDLLSQGQVDYLSKIHFRIN